MKTRRILPVFVVAMLALGPARGAELLFEDTFSTQASLDDWVVTLGGESTLSLVEGSLVNMDGYLAIYDGDPDGTPKASRDFGATETGYLDVRMTGTKWAGSGVLILYAEEGPLFSLSLSVSNSDIKGILNGVSDLDGRENDVFIEPLDLGLESPAPPYGRDVRVTWGNGILSLYFTGIDGTVYTRLDKEYGIPGAVPSGVSLAAGYDSVSGGKTGYFDFIRVYSGEPVSEPQPGEVTLPYVQPFLALSSLNDFSQNGAEGNTIELRPGGTERGMQTYLHLEDLSGDSRPEAGLVFDGVPAGYVQARIAAAGDYQEVLSLEAGSSAAYGLGVATGPSGISVYLNDSVEPLFIEPLSLNETPENVSARNMALVWQESGRVDLFWETASGEQQFVPSINAMAAGPISGLTFTAGSTAGTGGILDVDDLKVNEGIPGSGLGTTDTRLPYAADFTEAGDLAGWNIDGTFVLDTEGDGILSLVDDDAAAISRMSRPFSPEDPGFVEIVFRVPEGQQEILQLLGGGEILYAVSATAGSSGYELHINGDSGPALADPFVEGETLSSHAFRKLLISWQGGAADFRLGANGGKGTSLANVDALVPGVPSVLVLSAGTVEGTGLELELDSLQVQKVSETWVNYVESHSTGGDLPLADYSMAGYDLGRSVIPEVHELGLPYFDVTDYGAIPDDESSDRQAIEAAIAAAEANGGGVVFFPPGVFLVNEEQGSLNGDRSYTAAGSFIVLKGSGSGPGGTVLFMRENLLPDNIEQPYSTPALFKLGGSASPVFIAFTTEAARTGSHLLAVGTTKGLAPGDTIVIEAQSPVLNDYVLQGLVPRSDWTRIIEEGPAISEHNRIVAIDGNTLVLEAPLAGGLPAGLRVSRQSMFTHNGVEDLQFLGNFHEPFSHHGNNWSSVSNKEKWSNDERLYSAYMDTGFNAFQFVNAENSWARRIRMTDLNSGITFSNSYSSSIIECIIDGNTGHDTFAFRGGSHNLIGNTLNRTVPGNIGGHHGPSMSASECLSVVWRHAAIDGPALDFHAASPRANLVDAVSAREFNGSGGAAQNLPNHLDLLTFWNISIHGVWNDKLDFWDFSSTFTGMIRAVYPNLVGFDSTYDYIINLNTLGIVESLGNLVFPESLFEAQMELRHGSTPDWVSRSIQAFEDFQIHNYPDGVTELPLFTLDLSVDDGGTIVSDLDNGTHPFLAIGRVTVIPQEGYVFLGWEGNLRHDSASTVLTMTSNVSATAKMAPASGPGDIFANWYPYVDGWHWCELGWIYAGSPEASIWPYFYSVSQAAWVYAVPLGTPGAGGYLYYPNPAVQAWFYFRTGAYPWFYRYHAVDFGWYYFEEASRTFINFDNTGATLSLP